MEYCPAKPGRQTCEHTQNNEARQFAKRVKNLGMVPTNNHTDLHVSPSSSRMLQISVVGVHIYFKFHIVQECKHIEGLI